MYLSGLACIPVLVVNQDLGKVVLSIYGSDISNLKVGAEKHATDYNKWNWTKSGGYLVEFFITILTDFV